MADFSVGLVPGGGATATLRRRLAAEAPLDEDENEAAFHAHVTGFLRSALDILAASIKSSGKSTPALTKAKDRGDDILASIARIPKRSVTKQGSAASIHSTANHSQDDMSRAASSTRSDSTGPTEVTQKRDPPLGQTATGPASPAPAAAAPPPIDRHRLITVVLEFVESELLLLQLPSSTSDTQKLRKCARDVLQLLVLRATSMLTHHLPFLVQLSLDHAVTALNFSEEHSGSDGDEATREAMTVASAQREIELVHATAALSDSIAGAVEDEERRIQAAAAPGGGDACGVADGESPSEIIKALLTGVLAAESCLIKSLDLLAQSCPPTGLADEAASVRVVSKCCTDVMRGIKNLFAAIQQRLTKSLAALFDETGSPLRMSLSSSHAPQRIVHEMVEFLGVDACRLMETFGFEVCRVACNYLVQVVAVPGTQESLPPQVFKNKLDMRHALFRMMDSLMDPLMVMPSGSGSSASSQTSTQPPQSPGGGNSSFLSSPYDATATLRSTIREGITNRLVPTSLLGDFLSAIGRNTGDENEGQLLSVKILTDTLVLLCGAVPSSSTATLNGAPQLSTQAASEAAAAAAAGRKPSLLAEVRGRELSHMFRSSKHRRGIFCGLLNAVVSVHKVVLGAALRSLEAVLLAPACLEYAAQEVGFLYTNAIIRLLESDNSTAETKMMLILHFRSGILQQSLRLCPVSGSSSQQTLVPRFSSDIMPNTAGAWERPTASVPLLLVFYRLFDLNRRLHQVHVVQQYVAALARIVRTSSPQELFPPTPSPTTTETLGRCALVTLSMVAEVIADVLPPVAMPLGNLRHASLLREEKLEDQRLLDLINSSPVKGICKKFFIDKATLEQRDLEGQPAAGIDGAEGPPVAAAPRAEPSLEYSKVPHPPNAEVAAKAQAVAHFLLHTPALNPMAIGEFLSDPKYFPLQVCRYFMGALDLRGRTITGALSEMLGVLQLPKEGQRIERLLEFFTHAYFQANRGGGGWNGTASGDAAATADDERGSVDILPGSMSGSGNQPLLPNDDVGSPRFEDRILYRPPPSHHFPFANVDACFIVVVATVMLNTDLHNPRVSSKMTRDSFRSQLRGCNDGSDFPSGFADSIFDSIHRRPLSTVKGIGAAGPNGETHVSTALPPAGTMDMLFFSSSERRELMFGMERQRLVIETLELLSRRGCEEGQLLDELAASPLLGAIAQHEQLLQRSHADPSHPERQLQQHAPTQPVAVAAELLASLWNIMTVVFNLGTASPVLGIAVNPRAGAAAAPQPDTQALRLCLRALETSLLCSTAFGMVTEADMALETLLKMVAASPHKSVSDACHRVLLRVAASEHAVHFSPAAWTAVVRTLAESRKPKTSNLATDAEHVFGAVEVLVARAATARFSSTDSLAATAVRLAVDAVSANALAAAGDSLSLGANLYVLGRMLVYTTVVTAKLDESATVVRRIAVPLFRQALHQAKWRELVGENMKSNDCLQLLHEFYASMAGEIWRTRCSSSPNAAAATTATGGKKSATGAPHGGSDNEEGAEVVAGTDSLDDAAFIEVFETIPATGQTPTDGGGLVKPSVVLRNHILQTVRSVITDTIVSAPSESVGAPWSVSLPTAIEVWRSLLRPVAAALSDPDMIASETCALAALVLRHTVVVWCGGSGTAAAAVADHAGTRLSPPFRCALGHLLAHITYVGAMCADANNAHACLAQLTTIITAALSAPATPSASLGNSTNQRSPASPRETLQPAAAVERDDDGVPQPALAARLLAEINALSSSSDSPESALAAVVVERLCLLLRCEKQTIRQECVDAFKSVALQCFADDESALQHLIGHIAHAVLDAALGPADHNAKVPLSDASLVSFAVLDMRVPTTWKRCSRTAFSNTLPSVMHSVATDVLASLRPKHASEMSRFWASRCLVPLTLSPRTLNHASRVLALRALLQVAQSFVVAPAEKRRSATETPDATAHRDSCGRAWTDMVAFVLHSVLLLTADHVELLEACPFRLSVKEVGVVCPGDEEVCMDVYSLACRSALAQLERVNASDVVPLLAESRAMCTPVAVAAEVVCHSSTAVQRRWRHDDPSTIPSSSALLSDRSYLQSLWSMLPLLAAPLPRIISALNAFSTVQPADPRAFDSAQGAGVSEAMSSAGAHYHTWTIPASSSSCLKVLLARAVNHSLSLYHAVMQLGMDDAASATGGAKSNAVTQLALSLVLGPAGAVPMSPLTAASQLGETVVQPHAAIRGATCAFFDLSLLGLTDDRDVHHLEGNLAELLTAMRDVIATVSAASASLSSKQGVATATVQLVRSCGTGMIQELGIAVSHVLNQVSASTPTARDDGKDVHAETSTTVMTIANRAAARTLLRSSNLFHGVVSLLSTHSSSLALIPAVKRYLVAFHATLLAVPPLIRHVEGDESVNISTPSEYGTEE